MPFEIATLVAGALITGRLLATLGGVVARALGRPRADADRVLASAGLSLLIRPAHPRLPRADPPPDREPEGRAPVPR